MFKKLLFAFLLCSTCTILLAACDPNGTASTDNSRAQQNEVHMDDSNFVQKTISIKKGESITFIADTMTPHILANGNWQNGSPHATNEAGAPPIKDLQVNGKSSATIGPFNTVGTFDIYCTIHSGMDLVVTVK